MPQHNPPAADVSTLLLASHRSPALPLNGVSAIAQAFCPRPVYGHANFCTRLAKLSATKMSPLPSTATPKGTENCPLPPPLLPHVPTNVPLPVNFWTRALPLSTT